MKLFFILLIAIFLNACTMYSVEKQLPDGSFTNIHVKSTRSFEQPDLAYTRTGADATFDFKAAGADNNTDAYLGMFQGMMGMMMAYMEKMMVVNTPSQ